MPSTSTSSGVAPAATINQPDFVFDIDIVLLSILALFFLVALPGAVVRLLHRSEWTEGVWFRKVATSAAKPQVDFAPRSAPIAVTLDPSNEYDSEKGIDLSDEFHISYPNRAALGANPPAHFRSWSSRLPIVHKALTFPVRPGYSAGKTILLLIYSGIMIFAGFYGNNPFTGEDRAGFVFASQVPVIIILATKNNVIGWLVGCGYEKLNFLHRFVGRFGVLAVNVHGISYIYKYTAKGSFWTELADRPNVAWGFAGLIAADVLFLLSTSVVRQLCYPLFYVSHVLMAALFLIALCIHEPWSTPYVVTAVVFYALDRIMRLIRSRYTTANLTALPELGMTRIEIPSVNAGWRAGQHVRIKVISSAMGWFGWAETHPFTIASVSKGPGDEGLVLMCKKAGDWTHKLYQLAGRAGYGEDGLERRVRVIVDGPYGGPGHSDLASHSGAMFVAGGSGITYALGTVRDLINRAAQSDTRVKALELVWSIPDPASLAPLLPLFSALLAESEQLYTDLRISVFYTRAPTSPEAFSGLQGLPLGLTLSAGRPKLGNILEGVIDRTRANVPGSGVGPLTGVVVGVCGPLSVGEELGRTVRNIPPERANAVGGIELHTEIFGW